jgi:hypothetical protein
MGSRARSRAARASAEKLPGQLDLFHVEPVLEAHYGKGKTSLHSMLFEDAKKLLKSILGAVEVKQ